MGIRRRFFTVETNDRDEFEMNVSDALKNPNVRVLRSGQQDLVYDDRAYTTYWAHLQESRLEEVKGG